MTPAGALGRRAREANLAASGGATSCVPAQSSSTSTLDFDDAGSSWHRYRYLAGKRGLSVLLPDDLRLTDRAELIQGKRMRTLRVAWLLAMVWSSVAWALDPIPFVRTPDAQFANLPGYAFTPNYMTVDGDLRMHYVDVGPAGAPTIVLLHGEPSWSYLYRKMIPPLAAAGYRVIAPDLIGFGRSDKPTNRSDYTYTRHVDWVEELLLALDLQQVTLFCQDWGGLIGLRLVALHPDRFSGVIAGNTALLGGPQVTIGPPSHPLPPGPTFAEWLQYSQTVPVFDSGSIVQSNTTSALPAAVVDAYRAPFPSNDETYLAGAREFPVLVGTDLAEGQAAWVLLQSWTRPFLTAFSDGDSITWGGELRFIEHVPGAANEPHVIVQNAGHFLQEDKGEELADLMLDFLARNGPGPVPIPTLSGVGPYVLALAVLATGWVLLVRRKVSPTH
jgi:haloalkane dehalogenase